MKIIIFFYIISIGLLSSCTQDKPESTNIDSGVIELSGSLQETTGLITSTGTISVYTGTIHSPK